MYALNILCSLEKYNDLTKYCIKDYALIIRTFLTPIYVTVSVRRTQLGVMVCVMGLTHEQTVT